VQKAKIYLVLFIGFVCFCACQTSSPKIDRADLVGLWENTLLKVDIKSLQSIEGKDSTLLVKQSNWEKILKIKPIQTIYELDSTWQSNYFSLEGKLISSTAGEWWIKGDTLWMQTLDPKDELNFYIFSLKGDQATFKTTVDWDSDGMADDLYYGEQERLNKP